MLSISDFKTVRLEDKKLFDNFYKKYPQVHSDYLFTTIISWIDYAKYKFALYEDSLILLTEIEKNYGFRPPIGNLKKELFDEIINLAKKENSDFPIGLIDPKTKKWINKYYPNLDCLPHRGYFEYVYLSSDLAELSGSRYAKIRNRLNKFKRNYSYEVEIISEENMDELKKFLTRWCLWKDCESDILLKNEKKAIIYSINHFFELGLRGILIRINGNVEAMSVYEQMNSDTVVIHYEKASPDYDEIYKAINNEAAMILEKEFKFINRESDMDIPGLKKAKKSYHSHHMIEVYQIAKENLI